MSYKMALFTFQGEIVCFGHALLNALDLHSRGKEVKLIIEGQSTGLIPELFKPANPFHREFIQCRENGIIAAVCKACSMKTGVLDFVIEKNLPVAGELSGHPAVAPYLEQKYQILNY